MANGRKYRDMCSALTVGLLAGLVLGCTPGRTELVNVERDYGKSVQQLKSAQIYDPQAAANPDPNPPRQFDGMKTEKVLEAYRQDVTAPEKIQNEIHINVGR